MIRRLTDIDPLDIVSLDEAKAHLRVLIPDDDALITGIIRAAVQHVEGLCQSWIGTEVQGVAIFNQWPTLDADFFYKYYVRLANVKSIDTVKYYNGSEMTTLPGVESSVNSLPAVVIVTQMPVLLRRLDNIEITFKAGYDTIPAPLKQAILILIGSMYEMRQTEIVGTTISQTKVLAIENLIRPYKLVMPQ